MKSNRRETGKIDTNEAVQGKPYLDIDRVITEGKTGDLKQRKR